MADNRRRTVLVNKPVQAKIIFAITWPVALSFGIAALGVLTLAASLHFSPIELEEQHQTILPTLVMATCALLLATFFVLINAIMVSHKVAGPMYSLRRTIQAVREGDLRARAKLRKGDFLHELADDLNDLIASLDEQPSEQSGEQPDEQPTDRTSEQTLEARS